MASLGTRTFCLRVRDKSAELKKELEECSGRGEFIGEENEKIAVLFHDVAISIKESIYARQKNSFSPENM